MPRVALLLVIVMLAGAWMPSAKAATASVAFDGDVAFGAAGALEVEVGGSLPGSEHDQVNVAGQVSLDGTLVLLPQGAFGTTPGEQATLLTWGARSGEFASVSGVQHAGGLDLAVTYGSGALDVTARVRGDVDGDGALTAADLAIVDGNVGAFTTDYGAGDVTGDGVVDAADQEVVSTALAQAVPLLGPLAATLLGLLLAGFAVWRLRLRVALVPAVAVLLLGSDVRAAPLDPEDFASLGTLSLSGASFTIDTDALTIVDDAAPGVPLFTGVVDDQNGTADSTGGVPGPLGIPEIAVFTFDAITLDSSATITIVGTRALALLSHGDATVGTTLAANGAGPLLGTETALQAGGAGGFAGGVDGGDGLGPGAGGGVASSATSTCGASAAFGAEGMGPPEANCLVRGSPGGSYGDLAAGPLQGGSGAGSGNHVNGGSSPQGMAGGGGGGAIEVAALGRLVLAAGASIEVDGGHGQELFDLLGFETSGGGSGGGIRLSARELVLDGDLSAHGGAWGHGGGRFSGTGGRVHLEGLPGLFEAGSSPSVSELTAGIDVAGGDQTGVIQTSESSTHGVVSVAPLRTLVPASSSVELGSRTTVQVADLTQPTVELFVGDVVVVGEVTVPAGGIDLPYDIELDGLEARVAGADPLTLSATLGGGGEVQVAVTNSADGRIVVVGDELGFTQAVANQAGAEVTVVNGTIGFPGDGVSNDDGLVNEGVLNLTTAVVDGDVRSPAGSTIHVAGTVVFNGHVSGAGTFSGTTNLVVFNGGYAPGD